MPLSVGDKLGPYEILAPLGKGGMGEVYRARDAKLEREVAIKVLPATLAQDPERLIRFEREAKVLASLNHPNIATIYGVEESDGGRALAMELVRGEILRGPLPLETALHYAKQIADALEAAHDQGIVHRDLKPANIMITPDGVVKVLDFGLAAVSQPNTAGSTSDPRNSPTMTMAATQAGMIMGTAAYMSPEQASGKPVDKRADIWSYGVVLYEMLAGEQLFDGETISHTLADVLRAPIDLDQLPANTPRVIRDLVKRCLDRDVKKRLRDIGEARVAIQNYLANPVDDSASPAVASPSRNGKPGWIAAGVLGAGLLVSLSMWAPWRNLNPADRPLARFDVDLGADASLVGSGSGSRIILSPDGGRLVYMSHGRLYTRRLDRPNSTELKGTEGANAPFFSPDGRSVAFFADGKLKISSVDGGSPAVLSDAAAGNGGGGSWGDDGNIIAPLNDGAGLSMIPAAGGTPTVVTKLAAGEVTHRWPQMLPGSKAVLFTSNASPNNGFDGASVEVVTLKDGRRKTLQHGGTYGRYLATATGPGYLIYANRLTLFAVAFDPDTLEIHGAPIAVVEEVATGAGGAAQLDFSRDGTLVYRSGAAKNSIQWMDGAGKTQPLGIKPGNYTQVRVSPDGRRLALAFRDEGSAPDIWTYDWQRDTMTRLTFGGGVGSPVWTPDGRYLVFGTYAGMYWTRSDGAGKPQPLTQSSKLQYPYSFTPDGKRLAFSEVVGLRGEIWTVPLESDGAGLRAGKPEVFLRTSFDERSPSFSPDGRWIAYESDEAGTREVYVRDFAGKGGKWQISNSGGFEPRWSRNGHELFFRSGKRIMAVNYTVRGDAFVAEKPEEWLTGVLLGGVDYDLAPDGQRVVTLQVGQDGYATGQTSRVTFLINFADELRRRTAQAK